MLSTENPPPDLCEISQLKSGSDERPSDTRKKQQLEVDLFNTGLEYNNPLPNFSIRDYVFSTRGKDIKNNWPFSQKNLQLCLKHGVKDVLPPFQSLDSVGNPSTVDALRYSDVKYPKLNNGKRPAVSIEDTNSSEFDEDKEFPSTTTTQSCADKNSALPIRNRSSEPETQYLPVPQSEKKPESKKAENNIQSPVKKCRLVSKLNSTTGEPKSNEDSAVNTVVVSESMASKVCPVCKTFTSSSNTTLNAHIDQCLSGESTVKWTASTKVIKHRIKPRKTKLMVDIYETALSCTLEDLDKRNGTNWASNMGLHPQDLEDSMEEEEKKTYPQFDFEDMNEEGDVYIDSSGTKLRILSKPNHHPPSKLNINDSRTSHLVKRDKGIKLLSTKKKKKKHSVHNLELQKTSLDGQGSCSPIPNHPPSSPLYGAKRIEINDGQQKLLPPEDREEDDYTNSPTASDHMESDDFGMIKQWVGSKRTGLKKKKNLDRENQHLDKSSKNLRIKSVLSLGDRENSAPISPVSSYEDPPEGVKRKENVCRSFDGLGELPYLRKGPGSTLLRSKHLSEKKIHLKSSKCNVKQSRKDGTSVYENFVDPPNHAENHAPQNSKKVGISSSPFVRNDSSFSGPQHRSFSSEGKKASPPRKMSSSQAMPSGGRKFSSLRTKLLSVRHACGVEPKKNLGRDLLSFKNPRSRCTSQSDEEAAASQSTLHAEDREDASPIEKDSCVPLTSRTRVLKNCRRMGGFVSTGEGETSQESEDSDDVGKKIDSFISGSVPIDTSNDFEEEDEEEEEYKEEDEEEEEYEEEDEEDTEMLDDFVCEPASTDGEEAFASFSKSLDSAFPNVECVSQYYGKAYDENCPTELVFPADQEMFCADKNLVTHGNHEMAEIDRDEAQGDYFVDVDPIPIPGPPGSFLPSPGRMGSEEILGHSSLTACRLRSSDDGHEVVDMDSSDSPISAISTVSNSVAGRSSSVSTTNFSAQSHFQHENRRGIREERINLVVEGSPPFESIASKEREREVNLLKSKANNMMSPQLTREVQNIQPCCCSRKDVSSLQGGGGSLNYQESQILRRRTMNSLSVLAQEKQINDDAKNDMRCMDLRAETFSRKEPTPIMPVPYNSESMLRGCGDCEFPSPSTSNPVLRLMGKNLMVVNKDDNLPEYPGVRLCVENGATNIRNEPSSSFHHMLPQGTPSMFDCMQFNFNSSDAFKIPTNYRPPPQHPSTPMFSSMSSFGDHATSAPGYHEYGSGFSSMKPYHQTTFDAERVRIGKADSCGAKRKEIIIIDDSPESEAPPALDSRNANPFYGYELRANPQFSGSPLGASRNPIPPPPKGFNANLGKWNCISKGSSALHSNSPTASLPSSVHHLRSSLYFAPGFS